MQPIVYLNGQFVSQEKACISPLDRGFLFGDGVYEVIPVYNGKPFHLEAHIERLNLSLKGIHMSPVHTEGEWQSILETLIQKSNEKEQWIYLQVTRGAGKTREQQFPENIKPTVFAIGFPKARPSKVTQAKGIKVSTVKDIRWKYCHIKTTARLAYVLMFQEVKELGFDEALIVNNGLVLEGTSSNIFMVRHGVIITPPKSPQLLSGITRDVILSLAEKNKIPYRETKIAERELAKADELWISSSTRGLYPVVQLHDQRVGTGKAGPVWDKMWDLYATEIDRVSLSVPH